MKKLISGILVVSMVIGMLLVLPMLSSAREETFPTVETYPYINYSKDGGILTMLLNQSYSSADEKIEQDENMRLCVTYGVYELYANAYSGEVYVKDTSTGNIMTSNPYDVVPKSSSEVAQREAMSQLILEYTNPNDANSGSTKLTSFTDAACHGQITVEPVKNGIRVNYILGNMTKRYALPASIPANEFAEKFLANAQRAAVEDIRAALATYIGEMPEINDILNGYEAYAALPDTQRRWSVTELFGKDSEGQEFISWGNPYIFNRWYESATKEIKDLFRTNAAEQNRVGIAINMAYEKSDYYIVTTVYGLRSAYAGVDDILKSFGGGSTRDCWELNYKALGLDENGKEAPEAQWDATYRDIIKYLRSGSYEEEREYETDDLEIRRDTFTFYPHACYVLESGLSKKADYERRFLNHANDFSMTDAMEAEATVGYTETVANVATFRIALEYVLDENGLTVTMPAKSIVYDETRYAVSYISVLPYFGSGKDQEGGFIFYPDGSGAIIDFSDFEDDKSLLNGKVYGQDYAFYSISGKHQQPISLPVYGMVRNVCSYYVTLPAIESGSGPVTVKIPENVYRAGQSPDSAYRPSYTADGSTVYLIMPDKTTRVVRSMWEYREGEGYKLKDIDTSDPVNNPVQTQVKNTNENLEANAGVPFDAVYSVGDDKKTTGYLAILEEGASLATLYSTVNETQNHSKPFVSIGARFTPCQSDKYNLADVMSNAKSNTFNIMAKGKYQGDYSIRFISLADEKVATGKGATSYYPTTYSGMATAYREYLQRAGVLTALENLKADLPLYIESFGVIQTVEKHLSIPVTVDVALTTFDNIGEMYDEMKSNGISNVKFRLTGFANGGLLNPVYPVDLKWEKAVGGKRDYKALLQKLAAEDTGVELFPNFDFFYTRSTKNIKLKKYGARSVDNRYAWNQKYSAVYQTYTAQGGIVISSDMFETAFGKFNRKYAKYDVSAISLEAAASGLSSNFDEDNFIDRETSLGNVSSFLKTVRDSGYDSVMGTGGNAYALRYMDYLLEAPLESSHFSATSYAVPFWGMVMHGSLQYTGRAYNEQANRAETFLRAIESGASLYFLLSYDNTQLLKDTYKSDYYSVNYGITKTEMMEDYKRLNELLGDLQGYHITDHRGVRAEQMKTADDIAAQKAELRAEFSEQLVATVNLRREEMKAFMRDYIEKQNDSRTSAAFTNSSYPSTTGDRKTVNEFLSTHERAIRTYLTACGTYPSDNATQKGIWEALRAALPTPAYGKTIAVDFDRTAVLDAARDKTFTDTLDEAYIAELTAYMDTVENTAADIVIPIDTVEYDSAYRYFTRSDSLADGDTYVATWSTIDDHSVVLVTYSNGTDTVRFLLNYNRFSVDVRIGDRMYNLSQYGYQRLN